MIYMIINQNLQIKTSTFPWVHFSEKKHIYVNKATLLVFDILLSLTI